MDFDFLVTGGTYAFVTDEPSVYQFMTQVPIAYHVAAPTMNAESKSFVTGRNNKIVSRHEGEYVPLMQDNYISDGYWTPMAITSRT